MLYAYQQYSQDGSCEAIIEFPDDVDVEALLDEFRAAVREYWDEMPDPLIAAWLAQKLGFPAPSDPWLLDYELVAPFLESRGGKSHSFKRIFKDRT